MLHRGDTWVVVPAYNEGRTIEAVIADVANQPLCGEGGTLALVVVDDGSTDDTARRVTDACARVPVHLLRHEVNRGLGAALRTALHFLSARLGDEDVVVTTEGDATQPAAVLPRLVAAVAGGADVAVATPLAPGGGSAHVPVRRRLLTLAGNLVYRTLFPLDGLQDYTNLVRAYRGAVLRRALAALGADGVVRSDGFEAVPEMLLVLRRWRPRVVQVPITIDFARSGRASAMPVWRTASRSLLLCGRHLVVAVRGR